MTGRRSRPISAIRLSVAVVFLTLGCAESPPASPAGAGQQQAKAEVGEPDLNYRERLGRLKYRRDKLERTLARLDEDRTLIIARIRESGVNSVADLSDHPKAVFHVRELREVVEEVRRLRKTLATYDRAIGHVEAVVRRMDRQARLDRSAPSEDDLNEMAEAFYEAEEQLRSGGVSPAVESLQLEAMLEQELSRP